MTTEVYLERKGKFYSCSCVINGIVYSKCEMLQSPDFAFASFVNGLQKEYFFPSMFFANIFGNKLIKNYQTIKKITIELITPEALYGKQPYYRAKTWCNNNMITSIKPSFDEVINEMKAILPIGTYSYIIDNEEIIFNIDTTPVVVRSAKPPKKKRFVEVVPPVSVVVEPLYHPALLRD